MLEVRRAMRRLTAVGMAAAAVLAPALASGGGTAHAIIGGVGVAPSIYPQFVKLLTPTRAAGRSSPSTTTTTVPPDDPPIPPMCRKQPWKCPDL
jgi:hypothetical protein